MRTFMLVKKDRKGQIEEIAGPCIEDDIVFDDGVELVDEVLFKTLHPDQYKQAINEHLPQAVCTWVEHLYDNKKIVNLDGCGIYTNEFIIQVSPAEVHVMFHFECLPGEAANLVLHLQRQVGEDIPLTVTQLPITSVPNNMS